MKFKPYEEYKKVDLPWIDKIPSHWESNKIKYKFDLVKEPSTNKDPIVLSLTQKGIKIRDIELNEGQLAKSYEGYNTVEKGYICLNPMDLESGAASKSEYYGVISNAYFTIRPKGFDINSDFYSKYFNLHYKKKIFYGFGKGVGRPEGSGGRWTLNRETFTNFPILSPPKEEQDKIADFLDHNLAKIDKFVELTERQIELLKEQKEVIINDAVTKGIDKDVEYKDSGIDWIGQIPRHWETFKNRHFLNENKNVVGSKSKEFNLLSLTKKGIIKRDLENPKGKFPSSFETYKIVKRNDIVFCLFDIDETPRTVGLSGLDGMITGAYNVFTINGINKFYLYYYYLAIDNKKALKSLYSGLRKTIRSNIFLGMEIPVPPINEQEIIVEYIYRETSKIDRTVELYKKEISLIKEYKTALIANAVTGKIDVRDYRLN